MTTGCSSVLPNTVESALSGPVLSGHSLVSGQLSKSQKLLPLITVILTSIKQSPLLSGRDQVNDFPVYEWHILSDIKLRKPKQQTLISNFFSS